MNAVQAKPLVSIIIPCYNGSDYIGEAIESVLAQSCKDWELIIIDDASTDDSTDIVKKYCTNKKISILKNKKNLGIAGTKNKGILKSKGEFIAFLDQDDIWDNNKLSLQTKRLQQDSSAGVICTGMLFIDSQANATTIFKGFDDKDQQELIKNLYITPVNSSSTMMIRRSCIDKTGAFDQSLKGWDDYELLMRIGLDFKILYEAALLVKKRIHPGGAQHRPEVIAEEDRVFEGLLKMHPFLLEYKDRQNSTRFFNRSIELIRCGETTSARGFAGKSLGLRPLSAKAWGLYIITLLPASLASIAVKNIFSAIGKGKLLTNSHQ